MKCYLAVDIGASSGRHIIGYAENGKLVTEEIHRFPNGAKLNKNGVLCWDIERLFCEILAGMRKCADKGIIPESMGIDTWGVDFVLTDKTGNLRTFPCGFQMMSFIPARAFKSRNSTQYISLLI